MKERKLHVVSPNPKLRHDNIIDQFTMCVNNEYTKDGDIYPDDSNWQAGKLKTHIMCTWWTETTNFISIIFVSLTESVMMEFSLFDFGELLDNV